jgi:hypothetical protein
MVTLHMTEEEFKSLYYGISNRNTAHIRNTVKQLVSDVANSNGLKKANGDQFWKEEKRVDAIQTVNDMYNRLKEEVNYTGNATAVKQFDFECFSIVQCTEDLEDGSTEAFDLIVLEDGRILNCNGDNVYDALYSAMLSDTVNKEYMCIECGTWLSVSVPATMTNTVCICCGSTVELKEVK